jgi:hypothetical protein
VSKLERNGNDDPAATAKGKRHKRRKIGEYIEDDTPKAFRRLMAMNSGAERKSGLDDDAGMAKDTKPKLKMGAKKEIKMMPGENWSEFSR